ncbi:hypothetical protein [Brevibacillus fulvus]|uniref:Uncharacterized protein n=1 Tax=Brevibacillus fulvus TaxID=1125967 RepID=A0A938XY15_9BACL|nr:hypothetical protein [Brevibacillus fulvus]MBM7589019.1 hypothetical protein [Brevibacillus fulvus]
MKKAIWKLVALAAAFMLVLSPVTTQTDQQTDSTSKISPMKVGDPGW